jgi:hypothetical protein
MPGTTLHHPKPTRQDKHMAPPAMIGWVAWPRLLLHKTKPGHRGPWLDNLGLRTMAPWLEKATSNPKSSCSLTMAMTPPAEQETMTKAGQDHVPQDSWWTTAMPTMLSRPTQWWPFLDVWWCHYKTRWNAGQVNLLLPLSGSWLLGSGEPISLRVTWPPNSIQGWPLRLGEHIG